MGTADEMFWNLLHERWRGRDAEQEAGAARSVLTHLRRRLSGQEYQRLEEDLPVEIRELWAEPELEERREGYAPLEKTDYDEFLNEVRAEAGLSDVGEAEDVVGAVFHAFGRFVGDDDMAHLAYQLPGGLKELWVEEMGLAAPGQAKPLGRAKGPRPH